MSCLYLCCSKKISRAPAVFCDLSSRLSLLDTTHITADGSGDLGYLRKKVCACMLLVLKENGIEYLLPERGKARAWGLEWRVKEKERGEGEAGGKKMRGNRSKEKRVLSEEEEGSGLSPGT